MTDEYKKRIRDDYANMAEAMIAALERDEMLTPEGVDSEQFLKTVVDATLAIIKNNTTLMTNQMKSEAERLAKEMKK